MPAAAALSAGARMMRRMQTSSTAVSAEGVSHMASTSALKLERSRMVNQVFTPPKYEATTCSMAWRWPRMSGRHRQANECMSSVESMDAKRDGFRRLQRGLG